MESNAGTGTATTKPKSRRWILASIGIVGVLIVGLGIVGDQLGWNRAAPPEPPGPYQMRSMRESYAQTLEDSMREGGAGRIIIAAGGKNKDELVVGDPRCGQRTVDNLTAAPSAQRILNDLGFVMVRCANERGKRRYPW